MDIEQLSRYFVECMQKRAQIMTGRALSYLRENKGDKNPFTGSESRRPGQEIVHQKLKETGLLDDADFCKAFGEWVHCHALNTTMDFMTLHDGNWGLGEDNEFKFHSVSQGELVGHLHSMSLQDIEDPIL